MKRKSLKINYILDTIKIMLGMVFPIITFPYTSRILLPAGIGKVAFAQSIINYFIMLSAIGVPMYGAVECAKIRDDKDKLSRLTQELFLINCIAVIVAYIAFFVLVWVDKKFYAQKELLLLMSTAIIFSTLGLDWFYQALEEYAYITVRSFVFQLIYVTLIFLLVKSRQDYLIYAGLIVFSSVGANITNFVHTRKYIYFKRYQNYQLKRHLKPIFIMFFYLFTVNIYTNLNAIMLGYMKGESSVGFYSAALKINKMLLALVISVGGVLMPRISYYLHNGELDKFNALIKKSCNFITMLALPISIALLFLAEEIIILFSGESFLPAVSAMRILAPTTIIIAFGHITGVQILLPLRKEKLILISALIGATVSFVLNLKLIPLYAQSGTAVVNLIAEGCVTVTQVIFSWQYLKNNLELSSLLKYICATVLTVLGIILVKLFIGNCLGRLMVSGIVSVVVYFTALFLIRDVIILEVVEKFKAVGRKFFQECNFLR
ncbi:MAG TPA: flippase [Bacillota bacterium]|nr:flippase [Bacillota bacterium]